MNSDGAAEEGSMVPLAEPLITPATMALQFLLGEQVWNLLLAVHMSAEEISAELPR